MYEDHYGFTGRPFQLTPDPRFWFDTATHRRAMSYLGYGLSQGEGFIVITGDIGAGKTTLVGHLLARIDREQLHAISIASTQVEPDDLLRIVAAGLDVASPNASKADLLAAIERGLHAVARSGRRTLLVIDEAQALPMSALEELRLLSNISAGGHALLQIFLLGQPEFGERLEGPGRLEQLRQRVIALHHLGPMEPEEVEPYMAHRLAMVGWNGKPTFTGDAFEALHAGSGGIPRRLNQLAGRVLLHGSLEKLDTIDGDTVAAVAADIAADAPDRGPAAAVAVAAPTGPAPLDPAFLARLVALEAKAADPARDRELNERLSALETRGAEPAIDEAVLARIAALETARSEPVRDVETLNRIAALEAAAAEEPVQDAELAARLAALEAKADEPSSDLELAARIASLEARIEDQDATLRRVLTLLVDWVENGQRPPVPPISLRA